ncbi:hypothetical protein IW262DRAFT_1299939 [Armillaria fumosa]|nr:hypothetical protein IW262DRAFT_1299939 [Armillaria fumosa]
MSNNNNRSWVGDMRPAHPRGSRRLNDIGPKELFQRIPYGRCLLEIADARTFNVVFGRGPFRVVPFYPLAEDPENRRITLLPELRTRQDIQNLNDDQLNSYLTGYRLERLCRASRKAKLKGLCKHIGCRPVVE